MHYDRDGIMDLFSIMTLHLPRIPSYTALHDFLPSFLVKVACSWMSEFHVGKRQYLIDGSKANEETGGNVMPRRGVFRQAKTTSTGWRPQRIKITKLKTGFRPQHAIGSVRSRGRYFGASLVMLMTYSTYPPTVGTSIIGDLKYLLTLKCQEALMHPR